MSFLSLVLPSPPSSLSANLKPFNGYGKIDRYLVKASSDVPDFISADWLESRRKRPFGPRLDFSAEDAVLHQLDALKYNDHPRDDYGVEVMYRFAGFDPFERSTYFGPFFDLGQFERFRRIFHHSSYRVLLGHKDRKILSSLFVEENRFKQRIWIQGARPEEEGIFEFTMFQVGWLTDSTAELHPGYRFVQSDNLRDNLGRGVDLECMKSLHFEEVLLPAAMTDVIKALQSPKDWPALLELIDVLHRCILRDAAKPIY